MDIRHHIDSVADYYDDTGARELSHAVKKNDIFACRSVADMICERMNFPPGSKLIPIPSRYGFATNNLTICNMIAEKLDVEVVDCIKGNSRPSLYTLKKADQPVPDDFIQLRRTAPEPEAPCFLFDAVVDSGKTFELARSLFSESTPTMITFAMVDRNSLYRPAMAYAEDSNQEQTHYPSQGFSRG